MVLKGKVALITGAGRGIGRSIAVACAGQGARTIVTGRDMDRLTRVADEIGAIGGEAEALLLDVTREENAVRVVEQVVGKWGRIDVLVNNAGIITYHTPVWATTMEQWDEVMNTNLRGMHLVCRAVIPHMMQREQGVIINIGSSSGRQPEGDYGATRRRNGALLAIRPPWPIPLLPTASLSTVSIPTGWIPIWPGLTILTETLTG